MVEWYEFKLSAEAWPREIFRKRTPPKILPFLLGLSAYAAIGKRGEGVLRDNGPKKESTGSWVAGLIVPGLLTKGKLTFDDRVNNSIIKRRYSSSNEFFRKRGGVLREAAKRLALQMPSLRAIAPSNVACSEGNCYGPSWAEF